MLESDLKRRVLAAAAAEPSPTRGQRAMQSALLDASALAVPLLLFAMVGGPRFGPRPFGLVALTVLGTSAVAVFALSQVIGSGAGMLGPSRRRLLVTALAAPLAFLAWKASISSGVPHMAEAWPDRSGLRCFGLTALFAAWPVVALVWERRNSDPVHPRSLGLALGVAAGAAAAALVDLWCPVGYVPHLLAGHVAPIALLGALGAVLGGRALALAARP